MIHRIEIQQILPDLSTRQLLVFRIAGDQMEAEGMGRALWTRWMEDHPGIPTVMVMTWPTSEELGGNHPMPPNPLIEHR